MIDFTEIKLDSIYIHQVGNKLRDEGIKTSNKNLIFENEDTKKYLLKYFLSSFNGNEIFNFHYSTDLNLNDTYIFAKKIFANPENIYDISIDISKHLYDNSSHPKINGGEFSVCYFKDCVFDGQKTDAIGLFKSENKDIFLKLNSVQVRHESGVNINKLDKGCLIFNLNADEGYIVCIVDSNKSKDTQYWIDEFLSIKPASDSYHYTKDFLSITKNFVTKQLDEQFEISKADKIDILNRSVDYFKNNETFDKHSFEKEIFKDNSVIESFRKFDQAYREENEVEFSNNFQISSQAVKKQARVFKSVLKLDKNFHIYIHGHKELIEQGIDENGRKFYKIYYENES